jgi:hypothetical protein
MMLHRQLFLILVLALSLVPVLQTAHALSHLGEATGSKPPAAKRLPGWPRPMAISLQLQVTSLQIPTSMQTLTGFALIAWLWQVSALFFLFLRL